MSKGGAEMNPFNYATDQSCSPFAIHSARYFRRRLLVENLEQRCLLTTLILEEAFKSPTFTATGSFEGITEIPSVAYYDEYSGETMISGQLVYNSPDFGTGNVDFSGTGTGEDVCWSYEFQLEGVASFTEQAGNVSQFDVFGQFEYLGSPIPNCAGQGPLFVDNDVVGTFSTSDFQTDLTWTTPISDGQTAGSWSGDLVFDGQPFDILPTAVSYDGTTLEFEFAATGIPATAPSAATPITTVDVFWARGTTAADTIDDPITQSVPVYWNQAGGRVRVTDLPEAPALATHLLVIADYGNEVTEQNEGNNVLAAGPSWQNVANPLDVDADGHVIPLDALLLINNINFHEARELPPLGPNEVPDRFYDVNGDGWIAPIDVLQVINYLNLVAMGEARDASGEASDRLLGDEILVLVGLERDAPNGELATAEITGSRQPAPTTSTDDAALLEYLTGEAQRLPEFWDLAAAQTCEQSRCDLFAYDESFWK